MLRTPSACAPSSSDSRAIRFRSRVVVWTTHSRSTSCWIPKATDIAPIRTRAIAESLMLTMSTPDSRRSRAASSVRSIRMLRGGSISTDTTNRPSARARARRVGSGRPAPSGGASSGGEARRPDQDRRGALQRCGLRLRAPLVGGRDGVERGPHRRDVLRGRAAAAADDRRPGVEQAGHDAAEVGGLRGVDEAALGALRQAGVGHHRAGRLAIARRAELAEGVEARDRADPAVDADRVHARLAERDQRPRPASSRRRARGPRRTSSTRSRARRPRRAPRPPRAAGGGGRRRSR